MKPLIRIGRSVIAALTIMLLTGCAGQQPLSETIHYYQAESKKPFADVVAELKVAITEYNFRITAHNRLGKVIRQREGIAFADSEAIQFCNVAEAKRIIQISPGAVRHMPCNVVIYEEGGRVIVNTRLLPVDTDNPELNRISERINGKLKAIVDFAVEE